MFLPDATPYSLSPEEKLAYLHEQLDELLAHHTTRCPHYRTLVEDWRRHRDSDEVCSENYPFIPVTLFKEYDLKSTSDEVMTLRSSATTSNSASRIYVDRATKKRQALSSSKVMADTVGRQKRPYLVFDEEKTVRGTGSLSARGAAILSLVHQASDFYFVLREDDGQLTVDEKALRAALDAIGGQPFLAYGFTYILYQVHRELASCGSSLPAAHPESVLLHSGGWKRLTNIAVDKATFNDTVCGVWQLPPTQVIDFYGTIEQVGIPYPDCSEGRKHVPYWADVVIRRSDTLEPVGVGETGLIQLISCLPLSAPNHSVLTEDLGQFLLPDECPCGRRGKAFVFKGRAPRSETRGCSDVARN